MSKEDLDRPALTPDERDFLEGLNASFTPPQLSNARWMAIDARVRERLERSSSLWPGGRTSMILAWAGPMGLAAVGLAFVVAGFGVGGSPDGGEALAPMNGQLDRVAEEAWAQRLFYGDPGEMLLEDEGSGIALPPEYAAIDSLFFEG